MQDLLELAQRVGRGLQSRDLRIVLAESCTAGLVSSLLSTVPGISDHFCGSAVVYRNASKVEWLHVSEADLENPRIGPVSPQVAEQMCRGALERTPEATLAASVTGHLGPDAPPDQDGMVYIAVLFRDAAQPTIQRRTLTGITPPGVPLRQTRHHDAARMVLDAIDHALEKVPPHTGTVRTA